MAPHPVPLPARVEREGPAAKPWEGEGQFGGQARSMTHLLDYLADRVLLADGAMGTRVQATSLHIEHDFRGKENCTEILNLSRPDLVRDIHLGYLTAGADAVD